MPRIRSIKPEFWEDETIGQLTPQARLLFIASWNLADDEGLLRWTPAYLKASVFMYDVVSVAKIRDFMAELQDAGLVFAYRGGKTRQELAYIVHFRRHQKINRPQPGRLPPPSIQNPDVARMYAERDGWMCHLCDGAIDPVPTTDIARNVSIDHLIPRSSGGSHYPSNLRVAHRGCNLGRRNSPLPAGSSVSDSVNGSVSDSPPDLSVEVDLDLDQGSGSSSSTTRAGARDDDDTLRAQPQDQTLTRTATGFPTVGEPSADITLEMAAANTSLRISACQAAGVVGGDSFTAVSQHALSAGEARLGGELVWPLWAARVLAEHLALRTRSTVTARDVVRLQQLVTRADPGEVLAALDKAADYGASTPIAYATRCLNEATAVAR